MPINSDKANAPEEADVLETCCRMTIEFHFGSICDRIDALVQDQGLAMVLKREVRNHGNAAIRAIENHIDSRVITRKG